MKATTFITPPQLGHANGSTSYIRLISMAQVWLARRRGGAGAAAAAFERKASEHEEAAQKPFFAKEFFARQFKATPKADDKVTIDGNWLPGFVRVGGKFEQRG